MPKLPLPPDADALLRRVNPAVIATLLPSGAPHTAVTWYEWDGERVLVNMDSARLRLANMRRDPRVSVTVIDGPGLVPAAHAPGARRRDSRRHRVRRHRPAVAALLAAHVRQPSSHEDQRVDRARALVRLGGLEPLAVSGAGAAPAGTILRDGNAAPRPHSHGRVRDRADGARHSRRRRADGRAAVGDAHGGPADVRSHVRRRLRAPSSSRASAAARSAASSSTATTTARPDRRRSSIDCNARRQPDGSRGC